MATRTKTTRKAVYEEDFYAWSKAQADLLRAGAAEARLCEKRSSLSSNS